MFPSTNGDAFVAVGTTEDNVAFDTNPGSDDCDKVIACSIKLGNPSPNPNPNPKLPDPIVVRLLDTSLPLTLGAEGAPVLLCIVANGA